MTNGFSKLQGRRASGVQGPTQAPRMLQLPEAGTVLLSPAGVPPHPQLSGRWNTPPPQAWPTSHRGINALSRGTCLILGEKPELCYHSRVQETEDDARSPCMRSPEQEELAWSWHAVNMQLSHETSL